ncbi:recombinase family protein [Nonomuraea endophytica]|uniref:DNA invertase Pin-like site-specific DNA recombinase n=1 Tax=Nonomuraea endophytica TaxID=714136 RepID=A0A7W8A522_9ACTN|nr:recombinase family protein [Nonomuraea endophytica]MBB5078861.1 DNA invertase Pin-like site-specific DNA recombinase [Nonomuraea endophytica]
MVKRHDKTDSRLTVDYCRISDDQSGVATGVAAQHAANTKSGQEIGHPIQASYQDSSISAWKGISRPEYDRLVADLVAGIIRLLIIWHANRLHRTLEEALVFMKLAREADVLLYSTSKGSYYNLQTAAGRNEFLSDTLRAQTESDDKSERLILRRRTQAEEGVYGGGIRPFGWGLDTGLVQRRCLNPKARPADREYRYSPILDMTKHNHKEAKEIQDWAKKILAGVSINEILRDLKARKVPTAGQADGRIIKRNGSRLQIKGWTGQVIKYILLNPRTVGHSTYRGQIIQRGIYPPILSEEVQEAVRTILVDLTRTRPNKYQNHKIKWLGTGVYDCGQCHDGTKMAVSGDPSGNPTYKCSKRGHCYQPAPLVDDYVRSVAIKRISQLDLSALTQRGDTINTDAAGQELAILEQRKNRAAINFANGDIDEDQMLIITAQTTNRISELEAALDGTRDHDLAPFAHTENVARIWDKLTLGQQRSIVAMLFKVTLLPTGRGKGRNFRSIKSRVLVTKKSVKGIRPKPRQNT